MCYKCKNELSVCIFSDQLTLIYYCLFLFLSTFTVIALANQETARTGNFLGMAGVSIGIASTVSEMSLVGE